MPMVALRIKISSIIRHWQNFGAMECLRVCRLVRLVRVCGRTRERGEREREEKEKNKDDQVVLITKFLLRARGQTHFLIKK